MEILTRIGAALQEGDDEAVGRLTGEALAEGLAPRRILDEGLIGGMNAIGEQFRRHELFLPDVLLAAKAMYAGLDRLQPLLAAEGGALRGKVCLGTVRGDLHDIGKNLVAIMLRGAGFEVVDLGRDVAPRRFVDAARETGALVVGMSALLTTTMPVMKEVVDLLRAEGLAGRVKTVVGGAPLSAAYAKEIGADAYAYDAAHAIEVVKRLTA
ncbi:MAG: corrinoid protein [Candidatus Eisenbacteria bacterium]|uniref:Corrinoid protein n=1 Tax=Eiseniibacteriota bacterium TaxID=2212470 RepID=A0A937XDY4_UNCEI|nr:corrinoid protein [Candidatus Eisenbacteria bacterium]